MIVVGTLLRGSSNFALQAKLLLRHTALSATSSRTKQLSNSVPR
jgi:hypothetical protein